MTYQKPTLSIGVPAIRAIQASLDKPAGMLDNTDTSQTDSPYRSDE